MFFCLFTSCYFCGKLQTRSCLIFLDTLIFKLEFGWGGGGVRTLQAKPTMHSCKLYSFYGIDVAPCGNSRQAPAQQPALMRSGSVESCGTSSSVGSFEIIASAFDAMVQPSVAYGGMAWIEDELDRLLIGTWLQGCLALARVLTRWHSM